MQEVEMYSCIQMWPKGFSGNSGYMTLRIHREPVLCLLCLSCDSPGVSTDCRVNQLSGTQMSFQPQFIKYPVCLPFETGTHKSGKV